LPHSISGLIAEWQFTANFAGIAPFTPRTLPIGGAAVTTNSRNMAFHGVARQSVEAQG
jgi:hypothetical protein